MPNADATRSFHWPDWLPEWLRYFEQFDTYIVLFIVAAVSTAIATPIYILLAKRLGWVDHPIGHKRHERATATMGGLVIFATVFTGAIVAMRLDNLVGRMLVAKTVYIHGLLACTACMILLGVVDDRHGIRPKIKLFVQAIVALFAVYLGFRIEAVTLPWLGSVPLPNVLGVLLSLLWIVGITNAVNLTDGLDGLAAGICLLASAANAVVAIYLGNHYMSVMMVLLAGALLGFLRWNFHPARVFLGDTGSLGLGMFVALASLHSAQTSHTVVLILVPLFALGYPIFDTLLAIARRTVSGQPLFASDRDHIHHRLVDRTRRPSLAAVLIYVFSILLCVLCVASMMEPNRLVLGLGFTGAAAVALFGARVLGYLEWGGWMARWSGREETKVLHAAAALARLKIQRAAGDKQLLHALAVIAPEIGCRAMTLTRDGEVANWTDPYAPAGGEPDVVQMAVGDEAAVQFVLDSNATLDDERTQILEELCRQLADRLERASAEADHPDPATE